LLCRWRIFFFVGVYVVCFCSVGMKTCTGRHARRRRQRHC
jgi:hypothetical protein